MALIEGFITLLRLIYKTILLGTFKIRTHRFDEKNEEEVCRLNHSFVR
jgi:hypothetical protein